MPGLPATAMDPSAATITFGGLERSLNELLMPPNKTPDCLNVVVERGNILKKRSGYAVLQAGGSDDIPGTGTDRIDGLASLTRVIGLKQFLYAAKGGSLFYRDLSSDDGWQTAQIGEEPADIVLTADYMIHGEQAAGAQGDESLYIVNGKDDPLIAVDGVFTAWPQGEYSETTGVEGYPDRWDEDMPSRLLLIGEGSASRMLAWGFAGDPNRIDYSALGKPWNFLAFDVMVAEEPEEQVPQDGGYFYALDGDGDPVVDIQQFFEYIAVIKRRKTLFYSGDMTDINLMARVAAGAISAKSVQVVNDTIFMWSEDGPRKIRPTDTYGDVTTDELRYSIIDLAQRVSGANMNEIVSYHDRLHHRVVWLCPFDGNGTNDAGFAYSYELGEWFRWSGAMCEQSDVLVVPKLAQAAAPIYGGTLDGKVVQLETGTTDDGEAISSYYVTKWFQAVPAQGVQIKQFDAVFGPGGNSNVVIYFGKDYEAGFTEVDTQMGAVGTDYDSGWDFGQWDSTFVWDEEVSIIRRYMLESYAHLYRFKIVDTGEYGFEVVAIQPSVVMRGRL